MVSRWTKLLFIDVVLLLATYLILSDLQWRSSYASNASHLVPSFSYLPFIRYFTMTGRAFPLVSPPTLDWLQIVLYTAVIANLWYVYSFLREREANKGAEQAGSLQQLSAPK